MNVDFLLFQTVLKKCMANMQQTYVTKWKNHDIENLIIEYLSLIINIVGYVIKTLLSKILLAVLFMLFSVNYETQFLPCFVNSGRTKAFRSDHHITGIKEKQYRKFVPMAYSLNIHFSALCYLLELHKPSKDMHNYSHLCPTRWCERRSRY